MNTNDYNANDYKANILRDQDSAMLDALYDAIMNDLKNAGARALKDIPVVLLKIDKAYQTDARVASKKRKADIIRLARRWDENKLEPITVVPHPEEKQFYVVNGCGRWQASQMLDEKYTYLCAFVLLGALNYSPEERQKFEAELFVSQDGETSRLTPIQKNGGESVLKNPYVLLLNKLQNEYGFECSEDKGARAKAFLVRTPMH